MKNIGLFFGSFNPIHIGHLLLATHIKEHYNFDEIWFIVSPQNPQKKNTDLANENHRLEMVNLAIQNTTYFKVIDIEFNLPKPSYTYITLQELIKKYPKNIFHLIIGTDNYETIETWKNYTWIKDNINIVIYNRNTNNTNKIENNKNAKLPIFDISATEIRQRIKENKSIQFFVTNNVEKYILENKLYK